MLPPLTVAFLLLTTTQEIQNKQKVGPSDDGPRRGPESLPVGHHDIITDIATFQTTQGFIVTASRDGIVKQFWLPGSGALAQ